ncbi:MAG: Bro-N domain-containing protein [Xenococcus sp. (in: cyanobacteria)]
MTNLQLFDFEGHDWSVVGTPENPEWVARDVAEVLGITQSTLRSRLQKMPDKWKGVYLIDTNKGQRKVTTLTEPGLYALIFRSDKPEAVKFQHWVFQEVLPAIRKTGKYQLTPEMREALGNFNFESCLDYAIDEREKVKRKNYELEAQLHYAHSLHRSSRHFLLRTRLVVKRLERTEPLARGLSAVEGEMILIASMFWV